MGTMSVKRKDSNNRVLQKGEGQRADGRYYFKYIDKNGKQKFLYSWRLNETDPLPKGKRDCIPLRTQIEEYYRNKYDGIDYSAKKLTVSQLYDKQNALKPNVRKSTIQGRERLKELLQEDSFGSMPIDAVKPSDAKQWAIRMSEKGYAYQTINNYKRSLKAAFYTAVNDDLIRKNPFNWNMSDFIPDDTKRKEALTQEQTSRLLDFAKNDSVYSKYYNAIVVLLNTGLRISELCGLTDNDIDFENGFINVTHQLLKDKDGYHISEPKTESGKRKIPMLAVTRNALQEQMQNRKNAKKIAIDGYSNFIFLAPSGYPAYCVTFERIFKNLVKKYNKKSKEMILPAITPHVLRHTFCTNMANAKMTPNNLQYIMGHKNITMTLGYYTHASCESAMSEMLEIQNVA